jgi:hypothetical protein
MDFASISSVPPSAVLLYLGTVVPELSVPTSFALHRLRTPFIPNVLLDPETDDSLTALAAVLRLGIPNRHHLRTLWDHYISVRESGQKSIFLCCRTVDIQQYRLRITFLCHVLAHQTSRSISHLQQFSSQ